MTNVTENFDEGLLGYYRSPTLAKETVVFVSEDDLWSVPISGGVARRLSSGLGRVLSPVLSPDGRWLAFNSTEEGRAEVYLMPAEGGAPQRLTYLGCDTRVVGWKDNENVLFASNHQQAFSRLTDIYSVHLSSRVIGRVSCGPATHLDMDDKGRVVITRHGGTDLAYWKRYRGGRAGEIWVDSEGRGTYRKLFSRTQGKGLMNTARPFWMGERIFFVSDHEGIGAIYSVNSDGSQLQRHTANTEYYVRGLARESAPGGTRFVFHSGGDLYILETQESPLLPPKKIPIEYRSPRTQTNRRFVSATDYLEDYELHPSGERAVITARGKVFSFPLWRGPVLMHGQEGALRTRLGRFLKDGKRVVAVSDAGGEEALEIHDVENRQIIERLLNLQLGRTLDMKLSPVADQAVLTNHRNELIWVDLETHESRVLDRSIYSRILGFNWSPGGRYIAYSSSDNERTSSIKICDVKTGQVHRVTRPLLRDVKPVFDPSGDYLYFLSYREFDPVYDNLHFDLGFPRGCRPYLLTLRKDVLSPLSLEVRSRESKDDDKKKSKKDAKIDFDGIEDRLIGLPIADGRYGQIAVGKDKIYFTRLPIEGALYAESSTSPRSSRAQLEVFDFKTERVETIVNNITSFRLSKDGKLIFYRSGNGLRLIRAGEKPGREAEDFPRSGWLDMNRVQVPVIPRSEWRQMYREAWRLQRDHFWTEDMSHVDWAQVYERYWPLLDRVNSRTEVSDVIWEMQGELGTSHAYEIGGDYRPDPDFGIGFLGAEFEFDESASAYRLARVLKGDLWDEYCSSPLARAGILLEEGDYILAIDGKPLTRDVQPAERLLYRAGREVAVTFRRRGEDEVQTRSVRTLRSEQRLRYREWVERNRNFVHQRSNGRIGYVHIPNMGPFGYAEFHRAFLYELDCEGLIIDVRFNGGGHVSQLLLEKLARRRIGYSKSRWFGVQPYPEESPAGPMVALTNEYAGSDGDIFSHSFKLLGLGPLVGKRTWGGVIGISPSHSLVDGGMTTQPEYSFWFADVGWKVENYGTEPDIEVEIAPEDYVAERDPQLEKSLKLCLELCETHPPLKPELEKVPDPF